MEKNLKKIVERKDFKIAAAVGLCLITAKFFPIIQYMAASFAAILCMQDDVKLSWKFGVNRMIITLVGGIVGILVVILDNQIQNEWVFIALAIAGILLTLWACKLTGVQYINAMIGCITFILVIMVMPGQQRILYAGLRLLGTAYGVVVSLVINAIFEFIYLRLNPARTEKPLP